MEGIKAQGTRIQEPVWWVWGQRPAQRGKGTSESTWCLTEQPAWATRQWLMLSLGPLLLHLRGPLGGPAEET